MLVANEKGLPSSDKQTADTKWKKQNSWNHIKTPNGREFVEKNAFCGIL